ncbi:MULTISPECIES: maleylpyruvate isomerase family mycothiol-dependent enzyme [Pseudonocardia]|uniref:Mycothiol-dependent maleylpyruvate isomerase metal-binding domain-containing protein n=2 Tax=Pseudonocardia TaxID=1847 RepID=A0A1Y2N1X2_PSEAH|nr:MULTISPECIES: maleylpyruvate isomerase family mycothiol-dependent enzyme [Pseudonocardia]OSY41440.1 hypothetical protein BG845_01931 [Pseudonocardia autotrophica]TDN71397.1 uncharacterized protein (TIGR03083 family) [Pseudonocardia autotrophica]BBG02073.1 hypothetical protein Pdca_32820 [Pseudonocardia autotrophica]GEC24087.1 hypothetical protein PSA01_11160 [Pseudonocardia saturnea]
MDELWALVHAERAALVADLTGLDEDRWELPSSCPGWTVHDVVAHLVDSACTTRAGFVADLVRARFDFDRLNARGVARQRRATGAATLARLAQVATRTSGPPVDRATRLVEEIVHGEDVRRPLGVRRNHPLDAVVPALEYQARTPASFGGGRELTAVARFTATDTELSIGSGAEVTGTALALLLTLSGRATARDELAGPGLEFLISAPPR